MVDIHIGAAIPQVQNNQRERDNSRRQAPRKKVAQERRKKKADRRHSVRNGVTVTLSTYPDRRKNADRRKTVYTSGGR